MLWLFGGNGLPWDLLRPEHEYVQLRASPDLAHAEPFTL